MEKRIVIGYKGEIGRAISNIFEATDGEDKDDIYIGPKNGKITRTIMHICIPYNIYFICHVLEYIEKHDPDMVLIHSTVPVGVTRKLWKSYPLGALRPAIAHCPVNCRHPNTKKDIMKYDMFVGSMHPDLTDDVCDYIERFGIITYPCDTPESTEFCKIMSTEFCREMVQFYSMMQKITEKNSHLNWKECIAYFENIAKKSNVWNRVYRRRDRIDTQISGKHCLNSNHEFFKRFLMEL